MTTEDHIQKVCAAAILLIGTDDSGACVRGLLDALGAALTHAYTQGRTDAEEAHRIALMSVQASLDGSLH